MNENVFNFVMHATSLAKYPSNGLMKCASSSKMNVGFVERKFTCEKNNQCPCCRFACSSFDSLQQFRMLAQKKMTAGDLLDKSQEAMDTSLKAVRSHIVFDDYAVTVFDGDIENPEKAGVKFDMKVEAFLDPAKIHVQSNVVPRGVKAFNMDLYQVEDRLFVTDEHKDEWEEVSSGSVEELFGSISIRTITRFLTCQNSKSSRTSLSWSRSSMDMH